MAHRDLIARAEALGVSASYLDWRRRRVQVPPETLAAIVDVLDQPVWGSAAEGSAAVPQSKPRIPSKRSWGFTVQLYSVRSRRSWGHGDLRDLADLARWSGRALGAGFILINPLHAAEPASPLSNSPYLPMTRRYTSPLYLRIEDIAEFAGLSAQARAQIEQLAAPLRAASRTPGLIDRDRVWAAKRTALELIHQVRRSSKREADYRGFIEHEGDELAAWATWCALAELHGPDWRVWPAELRDSRGIVDQTAAPRAEFHAWLQWLADEQLADAQRAARDAGMEIGVIADLAVGAHPGGADAWAQQDMLVRGMSVGAPPDGFNQRGQDWAQPPWNPLAVASSGGRPLARLFRAGMRHAGGLRVDHVMGLMRLWWIPEGRPPDRGAYVSYDHRIMVGALTKEAAKADALAVGEDLGTVEPWIRDYLAGQHVLGTELLWFAREPNGSPLAARHWRRSCMATVGTHDVPPISGFLSGDQVSERARLGLLIDPDSERRAAERALSGWRAALVAERLLSPADPRKPDEFVATFTTALYGFLALTPAILVGVSLGDAVGERRSQNVPGTTDEYPNWRVPLCDSDGNAVLLEDLSSIELVRAVVGAASGLTPA